MALRKKKSGALDKEFLAQLNHARENLQSSASKVDEAWAFYRGQQTAMVDEQGKLVVLPTVTSVRGTGKPRYRARQSRNLIFRVVNRKASRCTQRVPSYQVVPSTGDSDDISAARLAEKVLLYGYQRWNIRQATKDAVVHALVGGEAFAWSYFDTSVGPIVGEGDDAVGQGEIRVRIYGRNECYWVPGVRFENSPWHVVEQARTIKQVEEMPGFMLEKGKLTADAATRSLAGRKNDKNKLVQVTDYLELPCPEYPKGRWITIANGQRIVPDRDYPGTGEGPVLRKLSFAPDPDSDRDLGLVPQLLDPQRTKNDAENKAVEWKNHILFPKVFVTPGLLRRQRWTEDPGKVYEIPQPEQNVKIVEMPPISPEIYTMADRAVQDLMQIAGEDEIPQGVEAAKAIQALIEANQEYLAMFIADVADLHAGIGHDNLVLAQANYTEPRLVQIKGDHGWESIYDFKGADLRNQVDVRVFVDSIEPRTKQDIERRIMSYAQMGWISPDQAMVAVEQGTADAILNTFTQDESRVGRIIQRIKDGTVDQMPMLPTGRLQKVPVTDPATGQPAIDPMTGTPAMQTTGDPEMAPGWMPRYSDNLPVFRSKFEAWMKGEDFERLDPEMQDVAATVYAGVLKLEAEKNAEAQAAMSAQAEQLGMSNAAQPQDKPMPSLPSPNGDG